jgi:hypothetical protein
MMVNEENKDFIESRLPWGSRPKPAPVVNKSYPPEVLALISAILEKRHAAESDGDNSVFEAMASLISLWDEKR